MTYGLWMWGILILLALVVWRIKWGEVNYTTPRQTPILWAFMVLLGGNFVGVGLLWLPELIREGIFG